MNWRLYNQVWIKLCTCFRIVNNRKKRKGRRDHQIYLLTYHHSQEESYSQSLHLWSKQKHNNILIKISVIGSDDRFLNYSFRWFHCKKNIAEPCDWRTGRWSRLPEQRMSCNLLPMPYSLFWGANECLSSFLETLLLYAIQTGYRHNILINNFWRW